MHLYLPVDMCNIRMSKTTALGAYLKLSQTIDPSSSQWSIHQDGHPAYPPLSSSPISGVKLVSSTAATASHASPPRFTCC